jgi:4-hydroxybenzoate polyprenyltransferase
MKNLRAVIRLIRVHQWIKNLSLYASIIFTGKLFESHYPLPQLSDYFWITTLGFFVFCFLSSASYIFNDIVDVELDRKHPTKRLRPIASGQLSIQTGRILFTILAATGLFGAFLLKPGFFLISLIFFGIHISYTLWLKRFALWDILCIASSFMIRIFAGQVLTGLHIPIMLTFSVIFISLFIASCKRRSELVKIGNVSRPALEHYRAQLLDFYNSTFATGAIITYALFTFEAAPVQFNPLIYDFLFYVFPAALGRKWLMVTTLPLVIIGVMRYAQLIYERKMGEAPERIVTSDRTLIVTVGLWGLSVILFTYVL